MDPIYMPHLVVVMITFTISGLAYLGRDRKPKKEKHEHHHHHTAS